MTKKKENSVSVKVPPSVLEELKDEQHAIRKSGNPEPTYAELLTRAWRAFTSRHSPKDSPDTSENSDNLYGASSRDHQEPWGRAHRQLNQIRDSEDEEAKQAILSNLSVFSRLARRFGFERETSETSPASAATDPLRAGEGAIEHANQALGKTVPAKESDEGRGEGSGAHKRGAAGSGKTNRGGSKS